MTTTTTPAAPSSTTAPMIPRGLDWPEPTAVPAAAGQEALAGAPQPPQAPAQDVPAMSLPEAVPVASQAPTTVTEAIATVAPAPTPMLTLPNTGSGDLGLVLLLAVGCAVSGVSFLLSATRGSHRERPNGAMARRLSRLR